MANRAIHEHDDHPDFKFVVKVKRPNDEDFFRATGIDTAFEEHALIYMDDAVALTLFEHCYAMWLLGDGSFLGGCLWDKECWLTIESLRAIDDARSERRK